MDRPDDSPPRSLREARRSSIPMSIQAENHPLSSQQPTSTTTLPPFPRKRSSPLASGVQPQHVSASISQSLSSGHPQQYHPHMDDPQNFIPSNPATQRRPTPPPPVTYPRAIQRVPPPALVESDNRYNSIRDEWSIPDQYLDSDHDPTQDPSSSGAAGLNLGSGLISNTSQVLNNSMPKGPIIERDREREGRSRGEQQKESSRDGDNVPSGGSAGTGPRRGDSLRRSTRPPATQTQSFQTKTESPPPSHNQPNQPPGQQRPPLYSDRSSQSISRSSPTYPSPGGVGTISQVDSQHYSHSQQPSPTHKRDNSPQFRFEERTQPTKAKTPDRSLPVQEENEGEEDVTIKPPTDRERARDRERQRELDSETIKPRTLGHRLPTPQFSNSPMMSGDRVPTATSSASENLSTTVRDDDYQDVYDEERDGRSSRAGHRYEEEDHHHHHHHHDHHSPGKGVERIDQSGLAQPDIEEQEDTETYTPRSPPANLPQTIPHVQHPNNHINSNVNNGSTASNNVHTDRVMYHNNPSLSHLHFRPRTASSDAGGMPNLDAAVLHNPLAPEYNSRARGMAFDGSYPFVPHTSPPQRVPTIDDIRALADGALHRQTMRPGAPIPPTPPNNGTYPALAYLQPSNSPPPPRATPYPFGYPYQHIMQQSPDPHQMLQHLLGMQTDSTFSPSSTPYPTYDYSPFLPEHFRRHDPTMSMRSSPSHMPVNLPFFPLNARSNPKRRLKRTQSHRELARSLPPRVESTQPRETTPEPLDDDDDDDLDEDYHDIVSPQEGGMSSDNVSTERGTVTRKDDNGNTVHNEDDEEADWVDEDDDDEDETDLDLIHYESLPIYHPSPEKRRRRWEARWNDLVKAFQTFDRETNSSMVLMAAPTHSKTFYSIRSRSLRRHPSPAKSAEMRRLRGIFKSLVGTKNQSFRNQPSHMSLVERFEHFSSSSSDTIETREEELKNTLGAALSTINALTSIYEGRDQRWVNEMGMRRDERERVDILLKQAFGFGMNGI